MEKGINKWSITATVDVGPFPTGVAVAPDEKKVYVTNSISPGTVTVIDTATNTVTATVNGLNGPYGVAVTPDGTRVYAANTASNNVSVIDTSANNVITNVTVGSEPYGVAVTPDGTKVYVANSGDSTVSVIDTTTNTAIANVTLDWFPIGVSVTPDGTKVYVASLYGTVSTIDTVTNTVTAIVKNAGLAPTAFGQFLGSIPVAPTITWSKPANIAYGTPLSSAQLDATSHESGTFVYTPQAGTVLNAGSDQTLSTTFTPNDLIHYTTATDTVSINVNKATPTLSWSNPANITYGIALNNTQLDATASVPGTFVYNPAARTRLSLGTHTLHVSFTPTDTLDYTTASLSVSINVIRPS